MFSCYESDLKMQCVRFSRIYWHVPVVWLGLGTEKLEILDVLKHCLEQWSLAWSQSQLAVIPRPPPHPPDMIVSSYTCDVSCCC